MRILFLAKCHPQGRSLLERPYGRFHHLPTALAARGHQVTLALVGHRGDAPAELHRDGVLVRAFDVRSQGPSSVWRGLRQLSRQQRPDWIIGCSDIYYGIAATRLAAELGTRSAIDSYDDFEAYMPWAWPLHRLWRRALRQADLRLAAGPQLAAHLQRISGAAPALVVPMAADPAFQGVERAQARERMGLPEQQLLAGYLGSLARGRDVETLWAALATVQVALPNVRWLVSGRRSLPTPANVEHRGYLADAEVPLLLSSLDLAVVTAAPGRFGLGSYPSKLYEAIACGIPMVCADLPNMRWIAGARARYYQPGDDQSLAEALIAQLRSPLPVAPLPDWSTSASLLERALLDGL